MTGRRICEKKKIMNKKTLSIKAQIKANIRKSKALYNIRYSYKSSDLYKSSDIRLKDQNPILYWADIFHLFIIVDDVLDFIW